MQQRDASQIDDYNIEASFQMGDAGSHPTHACQELEISFLTMDIMETIRGFHKVERERVQRIGAHLTRHQGIREQVVVKQVIQFRDCQIP